MRVRAYEFCTYLQKFSDAVLRDYNRWYEININNGTSLLANRGLVVLNCRLDVDVTVESAGIMLQLLQ